MYTNRILRLLQNTFFIFLFLFFSCKNNKTLFRDYVKGNPSEEIFADSYTPENFTYSNETVEFNIEFDADWYIKTKFRDFDDDQKKYAEYLYSINGEVLFIGFNDQIEAGVRAVCEKADMLPHVYFNSFKKEASQIINEYKITFVKEETKTFKNIEGLLVFYDVSLTKASNFSFYTFIFKEKDYIIKIDFWVKNEAFKELEPQFDKIIETIIFTDTAYLPYDNTSDASDDVILIYD